MKNKKLSAKSRAEASEGTLNLIPTQQVLRMSALGQYHFNVVKY